MKYLVAFCTLVVLTNAVERQSLEPLYLHPKATFIAWKNVSSENRITGGDPAAVGQFPYQAGLKIQIGHKTGFCGGTLISNRAIMTAAHCCENADKVEVILGSISIYDETESTRVSFIVPQKNLKIHEKWNSLMVVNDICILKLPQEVEFNDNIQPASLPEDDSNDYVKDGVISSGWGKDNDEATAVSPILRFVKSTVTRNRKCGIYYFGRIQDTHICFNGAGGKSTCNGDSGGPLVLESDGKTVIGITSFGIAFGCEIGWPPVFTRVSKYLPWIRENID